VGVLTLRNQPTLAAHKQLHRQWLNKTLLESQFLKRMKRQISFPQLIRTDVSGNKIISKVSNRSSSSRLQWLLGV